ncbi:MAG: hypothetical protein ACLQLH_00775 [Terracidiphilus sp.]
MYHIQANSQYSAAPNAHHHFSSGGAEGHHDPQSAMDHFNTIDHPARQPDDP